MEKNERDEEIGNVLHMVLREGLSEVTFIPPNQREEESV